MSLERFQIDKRDWSAIDRQVRSGLAKETRLPGTPAAENEVVLPRDRTIERATRGLNEPAHPLFGRSSGLFDKPLKLSHFT